MKILMTGATGYIGKQLCQKLLSEGHTLAIVTRNKAKAAESGLKAEWIECDLIHNPLSLENFNGVDAVINLIGESVDGRWTKEKKKLIIESRIESAKNLLVNAPKNLKTMISVSAQGYYGDRGEEVLEENSGHGKSFLSEVCEAWEKPFNELAQTTQTRVVILRLGLVMSPHGGALKKLIGLFKMNMGAALGSGQQWLSFIHLDDLVNIFSEALTNSGYQGVINAVSPDPVRNQEFTKSMCQQLKVIQLPNAPTFVIKLALGEMADLLLSSTRVSARKLLELGFRFKYARLESILKEINFDRV